MGFIKTKIKFQKLANDRVAILWGTKLIDVIRLSELKEYVNNDILDTKEFSDY